MAADDAQPFPDAVAEHEAAVEHRHRRLRPRDVRAVDVDQHLRIARIGHEMVSAGGGCVGRAQMWITRPKAASTLSCIISLSVGCGKTVSISSASSGLQRLADGVALDQLGDFGADHMRAEQLAGLRVEHRLHEALGLAERDRLAVADEGEFADLHLVAGFLGLGLGQADRRDLRAAIGAARDVLRVGRVRMDVLVAELLAIASAAVTPSWLALCASQGGAVTSPIAQMPGTLVRHIGSVSMWPLVVFTPSCFEPDILGVRDDADRDDGMAEALLG